MSHRKMTYHYPSSVLPGEGAGSLRGKATAALGPPGARVARPRAPDVSGGVAFASIEGGRRRHVEELERACGALGHISTAHRALPRQGREMRQYGCEAPRVGRRWPRDEQRAHAGRDVHRPIFDYQPLAEVQDEGVPCTQRTSLVFSPLVHRRAPQGRHTARKKEIHVVPQPTLVLPVSPALPRGCALCPEGARLGWNDTSQKCRRAEGSWNHAANDLDVWTRLEGNAIQSAVQTQAHAPSHVVLQTDYGSDIINTLNMDKVQEPLEC